MEPKIVLFLFLVVFLRLAVEIQIKREASRPTQHVGVWGRVWRGQELPQHKWDGMGWGRGRGIILLRCG